MARAYQVSFDPLAQDAKAFLSLETGIDFMEVDFRSEDLWFCCTVRRGGEPVIVIIFEFKVPHDATCTVAVTDHKGLSRRLITALCATMFQRVARITAMVDPENTVALKQVWRMGFVQEGYLRRGYDGVRDATLWGLLPEYCPYLLGKPFRIKPIRITHYDTGPRMH